MSILGLLGSVLGGGGISKRQKREARVAQTPQSRLSQSTSTGGEQVKAKAAAKLALIKTGSSGILSETPVGRKKLLGN